MGETTSVTIAGAGIGGLTAALCLARAGIPVEVIERAAVLEEVGAGIQLSPNASRILIGLGLEPRLAGAVVVPEGMDVRSAASGKVIVSAPLGQAIAARYGAPWWVVHRADLLAALAAAAAADPRISLVTDTEIRGAEAAGAGFQLDLAQGGAEIRRRVPALVGADGLRSAVRAALGDGAAPTFRRRNAWRATLPMEAVPEPLRGRRLGLWLGPSAHLVHYPLRGGRDCNIVAITSEERPVDGWRTAGDPKAIRARLAGWPDLARRLVETVESWACWSLADRPAWFGPGRGAATLLGDAAHAMLPFVAQGGAMAIEDAAALARCCAASPGDLAGAFRTYEAERAARVARVQSLARRNGVIYHLAGPAALLRDAGMRLIGGAGLVGQQDWIYRLRA